MDSSVHYRDDGDAAYLGMVATAALKAKPASLLLLTGGMRLIPKPSRSSCGDKPRVREGCFVLAGAPGVRPANDDVEMYHSKRGKPEIN